MIDELIKYDTAVLAKEKGFAERTCEYYNLSEPNKIITVGAMNHNIIPNNTIAIPTQSLLQRWLREVHKKSVQIQHVNRLKEEGWVYNIANLPVGMLILYPQDYNSIYSTYEEALEEGLKQALNLIK